MANHLALAGLGMAPRCQWLGPTADRLPHPGPFVGLTFDDGPDPAVTPRVLDMLAASGATATFFCIADRARAHPALVRRMLAEGHRVENHTLTHPLYFAFLAGPALRRQVEDAQSVLADITGRLPGWFRAPMGIRTVLLEAVLARAGLDLISWTRRGYDTQCANPATVLGRLLRDVAAGDVLLLHDGNSAGRHLARPVVLDVLPALLDALAGQGLNPVALPYATAAAAAGPETRTSAGYASR
ncbi:polysaccharide deacetylase family protein [Acidisphaera sp. L21]|uniref:polysaccharide deacetylase family protein n=1 Tax=Acidisphaera sp. L21 TaxID=1641851 RepID=UPI001C201C97|nr:polysaccharide deacetylase family protein [Acidisphaera sp. L21]